MEKTAGQQPVRVSILGQNYSLLAKGDPREIVQVAQSVDELLGSIAGKGQTVDSTRIAVLGCLHLADRVRTLERAFDELKSRVDHKTEEFSLLLQQAIGDDQA